MVVGGRGLGRGFGWGGGGADDWVEVGGGPESILEHHCVNVSPKICVNSVNNNVIRKGISRGAEWHKLQLRSSFQ